VLEPVAVDATPAGDELGAFIPPDGDVLLDLRARGLVDERADVGPGLPPVARRSDVARALTRHERSCTRPAR
jgi:hypothetical protein